MPLERWNWFIAVDSSGRWITTNGYADVERSGNSFRAALRYSSEEETYHVVEATISEEDDDSVSARMSSPGRDTPTFELSGTAFSTDGESVMIVLTDGTTVLGLTFGMQSNEGNI